MDKKQEEFYTVTVTVENMKTGAAQTTTLQGTAGGAIKTIETRTRGTCTPATEVLREVAEQFEQGTMDGKIEDCIEEPGVWFEVARKMKKESLCRDGDGNGTTTCSPRNGREQARRGCGLCRNVAENSWQRMMRDTGRR